MKLVPPNATRRGIAHLFGLPAATKRKASKRPAKVVSRTSKASRDFSHLRDAVAPAVRAPAPAPASKPTMAARIAAAARKAATPTGTGAAQPSGLAARILAAGQKRRGEQ